AGPLTDTFCIARDGRGERRPAWPPSQPRTADPGLTDHSRVRLGQSAFARAWPYSDSRNIQATRPLASQWLRYTVPRETNPARLGSGTREATISLLPAEYPYEID